MKYKGQIRVIEEYGEKLHRDICKKIYDNSFKSKEERIYLNKKFHVCMEIHTYLLSTKKNPLKELRELLVYYSEKTKHPVAKNNVAFKATLRVIKSLIGRLEKWQG